MFDTNDAIRLLLSLAASPLVAVLVSGYRRLVTRERLAGWLETLPRNHND